MRKYIVYQSGTNSSKKSDIWLLPMQTGRFRRPRETDSTHKWTAALLASSSITPSRDGKQIFVLGTKQHGELVRYDVKSHQFLPFLFWNFSDRPDIFQGWEMGCLCFLSRSTLCGAAAAMAQNACS